MSIFFRLSEVRSSDKLSDCGVVVVVAKEYTAEPAQIRQVKDAVQRLNPRATATEAALPPIQDPPMI